MILFNIAVICTLNSIHNDVSYCLNGAPIVEIIYFVFQVIFILPHLRIIIYGTAIRYVWLGVPFSIRANFTFLLAPNKCNIVIENINDKDFSRIFLSSYSKKYIFSETDLTIPMYCCLYHLTMLGHQIFVELEWVKIQGPHLWNWATLSNAKTQNILQLLFRI